MSFPATGIKAQTLMLIMMSITAVVVVIVVVTVLEWCVNLRRYTDLLG
jgi:uncharacterized membrane protein